MIAESHISIHTFVEQNYLNIDVFSCKNFDAERVIKDLSNRFQLTKIRTHILDRDIANTAHLDRVDEPSLLRPQ